MKIEIVNGQKGYLLKADDYKRFNAMIIDDKIYYFLPYKYTRGKQLIKEDVECAVREMDDKKTICEALNCDVQKLDNFLWKHFKSKKLSVIKNILSGSDSE